MANVLRAAKGEMGTVSGQSSRGQAEEGGVDAAGLMKVSRVDRVDI